MRNLVTIETEDGIELIIDRDTGESFASIKGYARMSGLGVNTISQRLSRGFKGIHKSDLETAKIQTAGGLQGIHILHEKIISDWIVDDNPRLAKAMLQAGVRLYLHHLAGFEYKVVEEAEPPKLPPSSIERALCVNQLAASLQFFDIDISNPRFKQGLQDLTLNILGMGQPSLSSESSEIWLGVAERAKELGYPVKLVNHYQSPLGKFVRKRIHTESKMEKRLCNGIQTPINIYLLTPELDDLVKEYMDAKIEALEERKEVN